MVGVHVTIIAVDEDVDLIDDLAERAMRSGRRVGLVVGYVAGGEEWVARVRAHRHRRPRPARRGAIFEIGSVTKVFTGLLLADLAERGIVGLDDPLARYLPASVRVPAFEGREIILADLASHTSGLPRNPKGMLGRWLRDRHNPFAALTVEDVHEGLARTRLRRRPGERVRYSNLGVGLLGQALERAAEQPYEQLVRERIGLPLELCDTVVHPVRRAGRPAGRRPHPPGPAGAEVRGLRAARAPGRCAPPPPTCCGSWPPTSTRPPRPWPPSSNASSVPGTRWAGEWTSGSAG